MAQDDFYRGDATAGAGGAGTTGRPGQGSPTPAAPGYGPPPYGAPYGPPGYADPAYGYPGPWRRPTNTKAILALVMAFVFAPVGLVLGVMARKEIRRTGEEGAGLALAGVIVGGIVTGFYALLVVLWIAAFAAFSTGSFAP
ncbi:DUF4190 domain-containing protein [Geodermatophilus sp. YIM 151500]|uniref:DUF4190 domain-containing protein n=1 Tax=Geodermatophilus sp. YIM 151500 TaxID=2984531 RepID=UPI0021E3A8BC|nr:DUF4190 domain-containing protein [Geodermatophilus sp. YIM 151500]MCV2490708.1 DUF4190 domain-containing protein [Geodermatophilus sp. YIM 151500]